MKESATLPARYENYETMFEELRKRGYSLLRMYNEKTNRVRVCVYEGSNLIATYLGSSIVARYTKQ